MITCGDLDGKPCEWVGNGKGCPVDAGRHSPACAPVLALLEARKEAEKWKRAAEWLASHFGDTCPEGCVCPEDDNDGCEVGLLDWALKEMSDGS